MGIRSFLAFDLPPSISERVQALMAELRKRPLEIRWVNPVSIHLTIVFLGDVEEKKIGPISEAVEKGLAGHNSFPVELGGLGFFGPVRSPRVMWIGLRGDIERLGKLRDGLQQILGPFGIKSEQRPFRAHLTLGRFREGSKGSDRLSQLLDEYRELTQAKGELKDFTFYRSDLKPGGAVYSVLKRWTLPSQSS